MTDIATCERDRAIVRSTIDLARNLGMAVVAEGIETEQALECLVGEGCRLGQGFLFARPQAPTDIERVLTTAAALPRAA